MCVEYMRVCVCAWVYLSPSNNLNAKLVKSDICLKSQLNLLLQDSLYTH